METQDFAQESLEVNDDAELLKRVIANDKIWIYVITHLTSYSATDKANNEYR